MNDDQLDDLKQFIDSRISQSETRLGDRIDGVEQSLNSKLEALRQEMLDGFVGVSEAIEEINKHFDERISKLEHAS